MKRGAKSGFTSATSNVDDLLKQLGSGSNLYDGDYTDDNNPLLMGYQKLSSDEAASFLHTTDDNINLNDSAYDDGYEYHDLPLNKLLLRLKVGKGATVLSDDDFDEYVARSGSQVYYRGWSGKAAVKRFISTKNNHVGNGVYGDGYYFTPSKSVANSYSAHGTVTKLALSPKARVIKYSDLRNRMSTQASGKFKSALYKAGHKGSGRTYGSNDGESQFALKLGYNVIDMGSGYLVGITNDAFVISKKY